jgi:hypothetical protein
LDGFENIGSATKIKGFIETLKEEDVNLAICEELHDESGY